METQTPNTSTPPVTPAPLSPTGTPETSSNKKWFIIGGIIVALGIAAVVATTGGFLKGEFGVEPGTYLYKKAIAAPAQSVFKAEKNNVGSVEISWSTSPDAVLNTFPVGTNLPNVLTNSILFDSDSGVNKFYHNYRWSISNGNDTYSPFNNDWSISSSSDLFTPKSSCVRPLSFLLPVSNGALDTYSQSLSPSLSVYTCNSITLPKAFFDKFDTQPATLTLNLSIGDGVASESTSYTFANPYYVPLANNKTYYITSKIAPKPILAALPAVDSKDISYKVSWTYDGYDGSDPGKSFENLAFPFTITKKSKDGSNEIVGTIDTQDTCYKNFRWTCPYFNVSKALSSVEPGQTYTVSVATQLFATNDLTLSNVLHTSEDATTELSVKADPIIGDLSFAKTIDISKQYQFDKNTFQFDLSNKQISKTIADTTCTYTPANVIATVKGDAVTLSWGAAPSGQTCYYQIYRADKPLQTPGSFLNALTFTDTSVPVGNHDYIIESHKNQTGKDSLVGQEFASANIAPIALAKPILATPQAILQKGKDLYTQITWTTDTNCKVTNGQCLSVWEIRDLDGKATYSLLNNATGIQDSNVKKVNGANSGAVVGTMSKSISLDTDFINAMKAGAYTFAVKNITIDNAFTKPILESDWATGNFTVKDKVTETPTLTVTPSKVEVGSIKASLEMSGITFPKNASINLYDTCAGCDIGDILTTADKLTAKITIPDTTKPTTVSVEVRDVATGGPVGKTTFDVIAKAAAPKSPTITEYSLNGTKNPGSITIEQGTKLSFVLTGTNLTGVVAGDISLGLAKATLANFKATDTAVTFDVPTDTMAAGDLVTVTVASAASWKSDSFKIAAKLPVGGGGGAPVNLPAAKVGSLAVSDAAPGKSVISFVVNVGDGATADMIITSVIKITHADKTVTTYATFVEKIKDGVKTYDYSLMPGKTEMQPGDVVTIETVLSAPTIAGAAAPAKDSVTKTYTYTPPVAGGNGGGGSSGGGGPAPGSMTGGGGGGGGAVILQPGSTKFFKFPFKTSPFTSFKDVQKNNSFGTYITILNNGKLADGSSVISGYPGGQFFGPDDTLTRSQWLKMVMNSFQIPAPALAKADKSPCKDVSKTNWAAPYFTAGVKLGLVDVYDDGTCKAEQPISRGDATELLFLAIAKIDGKTQTIVTASVGTTDVNPFKDIAPQSPVYKYIVSAEKYGFVKGVAKGYFAPNQNLTRGQATKILVQALGKLAVK